MSNTYQFTLILDGVDDTTPNLEDTLFEAGCDDALINYKNGTVYLDFDREGENLERAILSAIKDIESTHIGARIVSVAPEHLVTLSDIAQRLSMTRQAVSLIIQGLRGSGDFPKPILKIANKSPLWRWSAVAEWFYKQGKIKDHNVVDFAIIVEDINAALDLRNKDSFEHKRKLLNELENQSFYQVTH
ncbi:helix-turn-helix transcriptional regulator [Legionella sp. CNM-1927-20]|uniref:helix-turn-helix transcriptional regulator n=1 Tax=Legionella sp. CNM-1927-20 TaxID=3422221 RepID=UPI00403AC83A